MIILLRQYGLSTSLLSDCVWVGFENYSKIVNGFVLISFPISISISISVLELVRMYRVKVLNSIACFLRVNEFARTANSS